MGISIIKHLFTGFEWNGFLIQPSTSTIPLRHALSPTLAWIIELFNSQLVITGKCLTLSYITAVFFLFCYLL